MTEIRKTIESVLERHISDALSIIDENIALLKINDGIYPMQLRIRESYISIEWISYSLWMETIKYLAFFQEFEKFRPMVMEKYWEVQSRKNELEREKMKLDIIRRIENAGKDESPENNEMINIGNFILVYELASGKFPSLGGRVSQEYYTIPPLSYN